MTTEPIGTGQRQPKIHDAGASADLNGAGEATLATQSTGDAPPPSPFIELRIFAESFEDAQKSRIAQENRFRSKTVDDNPAVTKALEAYRLAERKIGLAMRKTFRRAAPHIAEWVKSPDGLGVGEHLIARLLGTIGDPFIAEPYHWEKAPKGDERRILIPDDPYYRSVSQLWSYCGHGDPARRKRKGMSQDEALRCGNPRAKMIVHLLAECAMKCRESPFRAVYDAARVTYADRVHAVECVRCGPSGKPAKEGSPWSLGHQHAAALRKVGKEILRELWITSRAHHIGVAEESLA